MVTSEAADPVVEALTAAGLDVGGVIVDATADGTCETDGLDARRMAVGCDASVIVETNAGRIVAIDEPQTRLVDILEELDESHAVDLTLAEPPSSVLPTNVASVTVIPPSLGTDKAYEDVVAGALAEDAFAVYEAGRSVAGPLRVAVAIADISRLGTEERPPPTISDGREPEVVWSFDTTPRPGPGVHSRAAVDGGAVYFLGFDGVLRAVDLATGTERWRQVIGEGEQAFVPSGSFAAIADGAVLVTRTPILGEGPDRTILAVDIATGELLWSSTVDGALFAGHPLAIGTRFAYWLDAGDGTRIVAVEARTGAPIWEGPAGGDPGAGPLALVDGVIYTGTLDGRVLGLDSLTGEQVFSFALPEAALSGVAGIASRPAVVGDLLLFGADDGVFRAVDLERGELVWAFETGSGDLPSSPIVVDGAVVFGSFGDGSLYSVDLGSGALRWAVELGPILSSPALVGGEVVVGGGIAVFGVDVASGLVSWTHPTSDLVIDSPVVVDGDVIIQLRGQLVRLSPPA